MTMFIFDLDQVQDHRAQPIVIAFRLRHRVAYRTSRWVLAFDPLLRGLGRGGTCGGASSFRSAKAGGDETPGVYPY